MEKAIRILKYSVYVLIPACVILAIFGWNGIMICLMILMGLAIAVFAFISIIVYGFGSSFAYTDKEIGKELKGFLGYNFGKKYEVLTNETRVHGDRPIHFMIKLPQDRMKKVENFCRVEHPDKCSDEIYHKDKEYKTDDYVERREQITIKFKDCAIEFSGVSF